MDNAERAKATGLDLLHVQRELVKVSLCSWYALPESELTLSKQSRSKRNEIWKAQGVNLECLSYLPDV